MSRSYAEQMQEIANKYMDSGQSWPATAREIAAWAIRERLWEPSGSALIDQCADQLARAMREEYITDPRGRAVRVKHAARLARQGRQLSLWADIRSASREHMEIAFQQQRQQIVGDCRQLKIDVDSYNENNNDGAPIQMVFDFTLDLEELEVTYDRSPSTAELSVSEMRT
ncbi:MAG: hypothetical protein KAY37_00830 [Phycisphaerae bacterium]|nr:hypothetical protein [Phycisphaerae bacterium]